MATLVSMPPVSINHTELALFGKTPIAIGFVSQNRKRRRIGPNGLFGEEKRSFRIGSVSQNDTNKAIFRQKNYVPLNLGTK